MSRKSTKTSRPVFVRPKTNFVGVKAEVGRRTNGGSHELWGKIIFFETTQTPIFYGNISRSLWEIRSVPPRRTRLFVAGSPFVIKWVSKWWNAAT